MKRFGKILMLGICIGIVSVFIQNTFHIEKTTFLRSYWMIGIAVVLLAVLFNIGYNLVYLKKMNSAMQLLESCRPQEYVQTMERLLQKAKGKGLQKVLLLNLTAGYCDLKEYEKALEILENMSRTKLKGGLELVHHINLCMCYFYTGQIEKAMALYEKPKEGFPAYIKYPDAFTQYFFSLDILAAIAATDFTKAQELLKQAEEAWHNPRSQKLYAEMRNGLPELKKEILG